MFANTQTQGRLRVCYATLSSSPVGIRIQLYRLLPCLQLAAVQFTTAVSRSDLDPYRLNAIVSKFCSSQVGVFQVPTPAYLLVCGRLCLLPCAAAAAVTT